MCLVSNGDLHVLMIRHQHLPVFLDALGTTTALLLYYSIFEGLTIKHICLFVEMIKTVLKIKPYQKYHYSYSACH